MMISIELRNGKFIVRKIGQNPSMLTVKGFDFDKYKKILEKINAYDNYKKIVNKHIFKLIISFFFYFTLSRK